MDRLTRRTETGGIKYTRHNIYEENIVEKLAEYEDAEEQGLLLWLPCKVGDKVYYFFSDSNYKKYEVCKIVGFHIDKYRTAFKIELCGYKCLVDTEFLGEKIFLTREEAEQALKERENNGWKKII